MLSFVSVYRNRCTAWVWAVFVAALLIGWEEAAAKAGETELSKLMPLADSSVLVAGASAGDRLVAVGERGHILLSDDEGMTWSQVQVPTRVLLTSVFFVDGDHGWAVGHDAVILRTSDAGEHWELVHSAPELDQPLLDVWFNDMENGFAIGAYGYFLVTVDSGSTWKEHRVSEEDDWHLNRFSAAGDGRLYIAAEAGTLYMSENGGADWSRLPLPYEGSMFGILHLPDGTLLAYGLRGHLFRSNDAGHTWTEIQTGTKALLSDAVLLPNGRIVIGGQAGTLLVSQDGGRTVSLYTQPGRQIISGLLSSSPQTLITLGEGGIKRVSTVFKLNSAAAPAPSN